MKGICFKEPLFLATIEGRKTQTRRIMKPQPEDCSEGHKKYDGAEWRNDPMDLVPDIFPGHADEWDGRFACRLCGNGLDWFSGKGLYKPRYKPGEVVYLKEPYDRSYIPEIGDKYDNPLQAAGDPQCWETIYRYNGIYIDAEWRNKLFMPEKYARYFIKITAVRAERLQDISDEDCIREGIKSKLIAPEEAFDRIADYDNGYGLFKTPREAYAALIDKINGKGTWESNPWVWVYDYELTEKPE